MVATARAACRDLNGEGPLTIVRPRLVLIHLVLQLLDLLRSEPRFPGLWVSRTEHCKQLFGTEGHGWDGTPAQRLHASTSRQLQGQSGFEVPQRQHARAALGERSRPV